MFKEHLLFEIEIFCNIINDCTVDFDHFNASLMNKSIHLKKNNRLLNTSVYYVNCTREHRNVIDVNVCSPGVRVFIEKKAQLTLLGTEMDFVETKLSSEFVFNNPNIKGTCGCGESFNI